MYVCIIIIIIIIAGECTKASFSALDLSTYWSAPKLASN